MLPLVLAALATAPGAAAHGQGGAPLGYRSTVTGLQPEVAGLRLEVLDADDRVLLTNDTGATVVILGYDGEPYLRVTPQATFQNIRSSATYLNENRYADVDMPDVVDPNAAPEWRQIADEPRVEWHDHRIHWMSMVAPPVVQAEPDSEHRILDWQVPLEIDGRPLVAVGRLDYAPPGGGSSSTLLFVSPALLVLAAGGAFLWLRRRREADRA